MDRKADAIREFEKQSFFWKHVLAIHLEEQQRGLAVQWAIMCAEQLLERRFPSELPRFTQDIADAKRYFAKAPDNNLSEVAREIWCREGRDGPQTAIAKLVGSIDEYHKDNSCINSVAAVIGNLFTDTWPDGSEWHVDSDRLFQLVLDRHDELLRRPENKN